MYAAWLEFTSVVFALARLAILRSLSGLIEWSCVDTWYQLGFDFQAGVVTGDVNESLENRTCDSAINAALAAGISAQKSAAKDGGSIYKYPSLVSLIPLPAGGIACSMVAELSPVSGAKAAIYTNADTFGSLPASVMTAPP